MSLLTGGPTDKAGPVFCAGITMYDPLVKQGFQPPRKTESCENAVDCNSNEQKGAARTR